MIYRDERNIEDGGKLVVEILNSRTLRLLYGGTSDLYTINYKPNKVVLHKFNKENVEINSGDIIKLNLGEYPTEFYIDSIYQDRTGCFTFFTGNATKAKHFLLPCLGDNKSKFGTDTYLENVYLDYKTLDTEDFLFGKVLYLHYRFFDCREFSTIDSWLSKHKNLIGMVNSEPYHITYLLKIPEEFLPDLKKFKEGKYSEFNPKLKKQILSFYGYREDGMTGQILYKSPKLREQLELELGTSLTNDAELFSIPTIEKEIYTPIYNDTERNRIYI